MPIALSILLRLTFCLRQMYVSWINGKLIGYRYVSDGSISQYLDEQKPYKWVQGFWKKQNYTAKENMTYDKVKLKKQLEKLECVKKENQTSPEDAYVAYKDSKFEIVPETEGNTLDFNGAYQALSEAVASKKRTIDHCLLLCYFYQQHYHCCTFL